MFFLRNGIVHGLGYGGMLAHAQVVIIAPNCDFTIGEFRQRKVSSFTIDIEKRPISERKLFASYISINAM
jgi:hypothetical protein